jgi:hypothetical protein
VNWQQQREAWNKDNQCARKACRAPLERRGKYKAGRHRDSGLLYCIPCTRAINDYNQDAVVDGVPLVVAQDEVGPTLNAVLGKFGLTHKATGNGGKHAVFNGNKPLFIGTAGEVWAWLREAELIQ